MPTACCFDTDIQWENIMLIWGTDYAKSGMVHWELISKRAFKQSSSHICSGMNRIYTARKKSSIGLDEAQFIASDRFREKLSHRGTMVSTIPPALSAVGISNDTRRLRLRLMTLSRGMMGPLRNHVSYRPTTGSESAVRIQGGVVKGAWFMAWVGAL